MLPLSPPLPPPHQLPTAPAAAPGGMDSGQLWYRGYEWVWVPEEVGAQWGAKSGPKVVREQRVSGEGHMDSKRSGA